jgi:hypothetical protein
MILIHASLLLPVALALALAGSAATRPVLQPNEHYQKVGRATAEKDIRSCISATQFTGAPAPADVSTPGRSMSPDLFSTGGRDPQFQNSVERCLQNKGYKVIGWE